MSVAEKPPAAAPGSQPPEAPIALDGLVYGIDLLDALLVLNIGDAHLYASWVRQGGGVRADEVVTTLRDIYRVGQFAARRLSGAADRREAPAPVLTIELPQRTAIVRRIRAYAVAAIFDAAMPLGMARLIASRLAAALEPELPLAIEPAEPARPRPVVPMPALGVAESVTTAGDPRYPPVQPVVRAMEDPTDRAPHTLSFGSGLPRRSRPPPPRSPEAERVGRLMAHLEAHAPEPHIVKYRLALRAGLTLTALENPEALGPEAMVLIETAVQDILAIDRAELRRLT